MLWKLLLAAGLLVCAVLSVWLRMRLRSSDHERNEFAIASPLSESVSQLVGIAGGIYVALVLLFGFLEIEYPAKILIVHVSCNPLALVSMLLACVQPLASLLWQNFLNRK